MPNEFLLSVPIQQGQPFQYTLKVGEVLFLLGANGTGKSSLVTLLNMQHGANTKRISAHRQTWFASNALEMTPLNRDQLENNIRGHDAQVRSRHVQEFAAQRSALAIFDLIDADTMLARKIADLFRQKDLKSAQIEADKPAPLAQINELMKAANLPIEIEVEARQRVMARKNGGGAYSVAELSDGERNAFLIAADILTAQPGTLILLDEPERHLHRAIISPLLTMLFSRRPDCAFVVSTHEIMLPIDNPAASIFLIRSCNYNGSQAQSWNVDLLPANVPIDESIKIDILGGRQRIIFVEGTTTSLDAPLYALLFPQVSILPKAGCRDVEYAVRGLRSAEASHWVKAWGIVDRDQRGGDEIAKLQQSGIFPLSHYSVEALYYHPKIVQWIADRMVSVTGKEANVLFNAASARGVAEAAKSREHFVRSAVERLTRRAIMEAMPTKEQLGANPTVQVQVEVHQLRAAEEVKFDLLIQQSDLGGLLERYPLRESGALHAMAKEIGLTRADYENAVRILVQQEPKVLQFLRGMFEPLASEEYLRKWLLLRLRRRRISRAMSPIDAQQKYPTE